MQVPDKCASRSLQGDQVEDFTQIDRKRLEFTFNTNIIAMCVVGAPPEPSFWNSIIFYFCASPAYAATWFTC